jgi:arginyl-tRNA synthetase
MLALTGNTAPYLQYSHVRIQSIFRKAEREAPNEGEMRNAEGGVRNEEAAPVMPFPIPHSAFRISHPAERALALKLFQFGEVLPQILDDHRPNLLCNYLYELASLFHSFFEACPVLKAEPDLRASRLTLCALTARTLHRGLSLLGIQVPERM